jgi:hypothetical protein
VTSGRRIAASVLVAGALGLSVFAVLAWQAVSVQQVEARAALQQFEAVRASIKGAPLVQRDETGRFERRMMAVGDGSVRDLHVLAYHVNGQRLIRADVPFWFFRVKGPAVQYALRGTDFDLAALNLTPSELQAVGACMILDEVRPNGDRLLAWTN